MAPSERTTARFADELLAVLVGMGMEPDPSAKPLADPTTAPSGEVVADVDQVLADAVEREQAHSSGRAPSTVTARNVFHHPDAHPLVLDLLLLRRYGADFLSWEASTLEHVVPRDFGVSSISHVNMGKIEACRVLHAVESPWRQWEVFGWVVMALNGIPPDFQVLQAPTAAQTAIAVDTFARVRTDVAWSEEVRLYVGAACAHDGVFVPPAPLDTFAVPASEDVDAPALYARWPAVRAAGKIPEGDSLEDEQLRRTLRVHDYVEESRGRLRSQLEVLRHV